MVTLEINNVLTRIVGPLSEDIKLLIREACSYSVHGAEFSAYGARVYCPHCRKQTKEPTTEEMFGGTYPTDGQIYRKCFTHGWVLPICLWDGKTYLFNHKTMSFPTGIISRVIGVLKETNTPFQCKDCRIHPITKELAWYGYPPRHYQKKAVDEILKRSRGIIHAATGTGKTLIIGQAVAKTGLNTLVLAHTKSVFNQIYNDLHKNLHMPIGRLGDSIVDVKRITVAMPQSLVETVPIYKRKLVKGVWKNVKSKAQQVKEKARELLMNTEMLIVDEAHHISASTVQIVANSCPNAFYRVGVSATPWRDDLLDILIEAQAGRTIFHYSATEAIEQGYLARPIIHMVKFKQDQQPKYITKQVLNKKTNIMEMKQVLFEYADLYDKCVVNNALRNKVIEKIVRDRYALGESILVIVKRLQHGENLHKLLGDLDAHVRYVNGENDPEYLQQTLDDLDKKKIRVCIATGIFSEGVDIKRLNTVINTTAMDTSVGAMQIVGRALRKVPGKDIVHIFDIADYGCRWLGTHANNRKKIYQTEPGYQIVEE